MDHRIDAFIESLLAERGASANTVTAYRRDLVQFLAFLRDQKWRLDRLSRRQVEAYVAHLHQSGLATASLARKLSAIKQFLAFLQSDGERADNPAATIATPKQGRQLPKCLDAEEIERLLITAHHMEGAEGARLKALLEILYASGLRVSELVSLRLSHLRKNARQPYGYEPYLIVSGKGDKERLAPLNSRAVQAIVDYLPQRAAFIKAGGSSAWLFPSTGVGGHLTRQRFGQLLKDLALKAGLDPAALSPHVVRHAFATHLLEGGADLRVIQELLGHADISTTQIYTHVAGARLQELVETAHPLSNITP